MKDIRLTIRAKNNILTSLREEQGMSIPLMSAMIGIGSSTYGQYETMATGPIDKKTKKIKDTAKLIMNFYDLPFEAIWTGGILSIKETKFVTEIDSTLYLEDIKEKLMLPSPEEEIIKRDLVEKREKFRELLDRALVTLTQREEKVLREIFYEGKTLQTIAEDFDLTRERIRQIKLKALRKLKHPSRKLSKRGKAIGLARQEFL